MFGKRNLYRRLWYIRKRRPKKLSIISTVLCIFILFISIATYAYQSIFPILMEISESKTQAMVTMDINSAVTQSFDKGIAYHEVVLIDRDSEGHVTSIHTDIAKLNSLSAEISMEIQNRLSQLSKEEVTISALAFLKNPFITGGPELHVKMLPTGIVKTEIKSEFTSAGINQTQHRIFLEVRSRVKLHIPFGGEEIDLVNQIPLAETIIVGKIPEVYTHSNEGLGNILKEKDELNKNPK